MGTRRKALHRLHRRSPDERRQPDQHLQVHRRADPAPGLRTGPCGGPPRGHWCRCSHEDAGTALPVQLAPPWWRLPLRGPARLPTETRPAEEEGPSGGRPGTILSAGWHGLQAEGRGWRLRGCHDAWRSGNSFVIGWRGGVWRPRRRLGVLGTAQAPGVGDPEDGAREEEGDREEGPGGEGQGEAGHQGHRKGREGWEEEDQGDQEAARGG
mmetsp:Transcript_67511/g.200714  ORF Transcript_67511/g.200714 Transcript_67511/m.200714 type:complete len:211 (-) Transcript_67511:238-870(-)